MSERCQHGVKVTEPGVECGVCAFERGGVLAVVEDMAQAERATLFEQLCERWCLDCGGDADAFCACDNRDD